MGLTRVKSIRFLLFEIKRVLFINSTIFKLTDFLYHTFPFKMYIPTKKLFKNKGKQIMFNGLNCDGKSQLSGILTEPLNPRELLQHF